MAHPAHLLEQAPQLGAVHDGLDASVDRLGGVERRAHQGGLALRVQRRRCVDIGGHKPPEEVWHGGRWR